MFQKPAHKSVMDTFGCRMLFETFDKSRVIHKKALQKRF